MEIINRTSETVNHHLHAALHQNADISDHIFIPKNFTISQTLQEMTNKQTHTLTDRHYVLTTIPPSLHYCSMDGIRQTQHYKFV